MGYEYGDTLTEGEEKARRREGIGGVREEKREKGERERWVGRGGASVDRVNRSGLRIYSGSLTAL